jgi:hypothetical protein
MEGFSMSWCTERRGGLLHACQPTGLPPCMTARVPPSQASASHVHWADALPVCQATHAHWPTGWPSPQPTGSWASSHKATTPQARLATAWWLLGPLPARWPTSTLTATLQAYQWLFPPPANGGHQHHQTPAPNLPRRCRQTGLDAKGVITELLRLKFYCSWTGDSFFIFLFFKCLFFLFTVW